MTNQKFISLVSFPSIHGFEYDLNFQFQFILRSIDPQGL